MLTARQLVIAGAALAAAAGAALAADAKAFTVAMPEEFLSAVIRIAVHDGQSASASAGKKFALEDVSLSLDGGKQASVSIRTSTETLRALAKSDVHSVVGKLEQYLLGGGAGDYMAVRFRARMSALPADTTAGSPSDAILALDFDNKDLAIELHRGNTTIACAGLEDLALWLLDKHLQQVKISDSVEVSARIHWFWHHWLLSSSGHRIVARFYFARFPVVPFTLDADGISTEDHVLRVSGHRQ